jgi:hypothetical protein
MSCSCLLHVVSRLVLSCGVLCCVVLPCFAFALICLCRCRCRCRCLCLCRCRCRCLCLCLCLCLILHCLASSSCPVLSCLVLPCRVVSYLILFVGSLRLPFALGWLGLGSSGAVGEPGHLENFVCSLKVFVLSLPLPLPLCCVVMCCNVL